MMIQVLPFRNVNAFTDIENKVIYISSGVADDDVHDVICDELGHILSGSRKHDNRWKETCQDAYGFIPSHNNKFDDSEILCDTNFGMNIGNVTGIQHMLLDYHLLQAYRKFSQKILGTEGSWEVDGENKIHLKPTPKGSFPVVVRYLPSVDDFQIPSHKQLAMEAIIAEGKTILGHTRRKMNIPSPDGGTFEMDGAQMAQEGQEMWSNITERAIRLGEPLGFLAK